MAKPSVNNRFDRLTDFLRTFMFDIRVKEQHGDQIAYIVLDDPEHTRIFPTMLAELNEQMDKVSNQNLRPVEQQFRTSFSPRGR